MKTPDGFEPMPSFEEISPPLWTKPVNAVFLPTGVHVEDADGRVFMLAADAGEWVELGPHKWTDIIAAP